MRLRKTRGGEDPDNGYPVLEDLTLQVEAAGERRGVRKPGRPRCVGGELKLTKARERGRVPWRRPQVPLQAWLMGLRSLKGWRVRKEVLPRGDTRAQGQRCLGRGWMGPRDPSGASMSALDLGVLSV